MRILLLPLVAVGVIVYGHSNAPTEFQMRDAFEHYLADQTAQTVEFIQETGGASAVEQVKATGNDRFEIRAFQKRECQQSRAKAGYDCTFNVDIDLANGMMHRALEAVSTTHPRELRSNSSNSPPRPRLLAGNLASSGKALTSRTRS